VQPGFQIGVLLLAAELGVVLAAVAAGDAGAAMAREASTKEGPPPQGI
jgi:hypothetical protein